MERNQEELKLLGFFGIFKESFKNILSWRKIFTRITLSFIFPLTFIYLLQIVVSYLIFIQIEDNEKDSDLDLNSYRLSHLSAAFWISNFAFSILLLALSLLATAAVVFAAACKFAAKPVALSKIIRASPRVWKRLLLTFLCYFVILVIYHIIAGVLLVISAVIVRAKTTVGIVILIVFLILYLVGIFYLGANWRLASVLCALEDDYGFKALKKSRKLMKGKIGITVGWFVVFTLCFVGIELGFQFLVVIGDVVSNLGIRIVIGIVFFLLLAIVILMELVVDAMVYFVCKSFHDDAVDLAVLAARLEVYVGGYVDLKRPEIQLEQGGEESHV